jgi:hypothetical protein
MRGVIGQVGLNGEDCVVERDNTDRALRGRRVNPSAGLASQLAGMGSNPSFGLVQCVSRLTDECFCRGLDLTGLAETLTDQGEAHRRRWHGLNGDESEGAGLSRGDRNRKRKTVTDLATDLATETTLGIYTGRAGASLSRTRASESHWH